MPNAKKFPIEDILTLTTGRMVNPRGLHDIAEICEHVTGIDTGTSSIHLVYRPVRDEILRQHPDLTQAQKPQAGADPDAWIAEARKTYGAERTITPSTMRINIADVADGFKRMQVGLTQAAESVRIAAQSLAMAAPEAADGAQRGK